MLLRILKPAVVLPVVLFSQPGLEDLSGLAPRDAELSALGRTVRRALADGARAEPEELARASGPDAEFWRGYRLLRLGDFRGAVPHLRRAQQTGEKPHVLKALGAAYYGERQYRLFVQLMEKAEALDPSDFAPHYYLGRHYDTDRRDFARAAERFEKALERNRGHFRSRYQLGFCHERLGSIERARQDYREAIRLAEAAGVRYAEPWEGLARLDLGEGNAASALEPARKAVALAPDRASGQALLARVYSTLGKPREAVTHWEAAAAADATDAAVRYSLYRVWLALGDRAKAEGYRAEFERLRGIYGRE